jgi:hypothetical protein
MLNEQSKAIIKKWSYDFKKEAFIEWSFYFTDKDELNESIKSFDEYLITSSIRPSDVNDYDAFIDSMNKVVTIEKA